ncbi:acyltransferase family protein [Terriglobus albidus]|uniref:acyltransferase family protein n=1 Tax=Terriglobus albidus TaxID=1592106 RepID=UPI0021DF9305|nr:acyltransferase [Terriglobus albidus]
MKAKTPNFYRPELDVLRLFAFLLVFFLHGWDEIPSRIPESIHMAGRFGVCVFFLLSAYLITELLEREESSTNDIRLGAFYVRRCLRIWPLYFAILGAEVVTRIIRPTEPGYKMRLLANLLLMGNWYVAAHGFSIAIASPLWSISVEEQFYVLWPSVRKFFKRKGAQLFSIVMFVVGYIALFWLGYTHASERAVWVNSFVLFQYFCSGCMLSLLLRGRAPQWNIFTRLLVVTAGLVLFAAASYLMFVPSNTNPSAIMSGYLLVNIGSCVVFLGFLGASETFSKARPLIYLGKISYGLYVFHWIVLLICFKIFTHLRGRFHVPEAVLTAARLSSALAFTILIAALSYRYFEAPVLRFKRLFEVVHTREV